MRHAPVKVLHWLVKGSDMWRCKCGWPPEYEWIDLPAVKKHIRLIDALIETGKDMGVEIAALKSENKKLRQALQGMLDFTADINQELMIAALHGAEGTPERRARNIARIGAARAALEGRG